MAKRGSDQDKWSFRPSLASTNHDTPFTSNNSLRNSSETRKQFDMSTPTDDFFCDDGPATSLNQLLHSCDDSIQVNYLHAIICYLIGNTVVPMVL